MRKEFNFTIGADPEMNLILQGRKVAAQPTIQAILGNSNEFTSSNGGGAGGYRFKEFGEIGWDGHSSTGEIRPTPAKTVDTLVNNMGELLKKLHEKIPLLDMSTLSYYASIGGHIHLSLPRNMSGSVQVANIHKKLASFYLPIMLSESKINLQLRLRSNYGKLSDYRNEMRGGVPVYEFRVPSAEWLTTRKNAMGTIAYIATVYNEIINNPKHIKEYEEIIYHNEKQAIALQELAISEYKLLSENLYGKINKFIKECQFYPEYKEEIDYIMNPKLAMEDKKECKYNIVSGWELLETKPKATKKDLMNCKKVNSLAKKYGIDSLSGVINITYNEDTNVSNFAQEFAKRVCVFNWKPKNFYFLFGLKNGISDFMVFDTENNIYEGQGLIRTKGDVDSIKKLYRRMRDKFMENQAGKPDDSSFLNALIENESSVESRNYIIGIPYDMRISSDFRPFISLIYSLEKKKQKGKSIESLKPKETSDKEENQGAIERATEGKANTENIVYAGENDNLIRQTISIASEMALERNERTSTIVDEIDEMLGEDVQITESAEPVRSSTMGYVIANNFSQRNHPMAATSSPITTATEPDPLLSDVPDIEEDEDESAF